MAIFKFSRTLFGVVKLCFIRQLLEATCSNHSFVGFRVGQSKYLVWDAVPCEKCKA